MTFELSLLISVYQGVYWHQKAHVKLVQSAFIQYPVHGPRKNNALAVTSALTLLVWMTEIAHHPVYKKTMLVIPGGSLLEQMENWNQGQPA